MERFFDTISYQDGRLEILDQTLLPVEEKRIVLEDVEQAAEAIRALRVRGAPLIGIAAGFAVALHAHQQIAARGTFPREEYDRMDTLLRGTRPTAVNLFWALDRMQSLYRRTMETNPQPEALYAALEGEAFALLEEDLDATARIAHAGAALIQDNDTLLTHCNAGALATGGNGTALAPVYQAHREGRRFRVFADETRPLLQGSRLTAWELDKMGIDVTVQVDSAAPFAMARHGIRLAFVGADRIACNGDTANKIGTYGIAIAAARHGVEFYVVAPRSTFDACLESGEGIPIEERQAGEIFNGFGRRTGPEHVKYYAPAFDVTPAELISGIITEQGILRPPFRESIASFLESHPVQAV